MMVRSWHGLVRPLDPRPNITSTRETIFFAWHGLRSMIFGLKRHEPRRYSQTLCASEFHQGRLLSLAYPKWEWNRTYESTSTFWNYIDLRGGNTRSKLLQLNWKTKSWRRNIGHPGQNRTSQAKARTLMMPLRTSWWKGISGDQEGISDFWMFCHNAIT